MVMSWMFLHQLLIRFKLVMLLVLCSALFILVASVTALGPVLSLILHYCFFHFISDVNLGFTLS